MVYVSSFHDPNAAGSGEIHVTDIHENALSIPKPKDMFPLKRVTKEEDEEYKWMHTPDCIDDNLFTGYCPPIEEDNSAKHPSPFDYEDIFNPKFTQVKFSF
jgi:hypothetical protein